MPTISENIKNIRELKNYTQEYIANQLGMTQAGYSKIENGNTDVAYSKIIEIAKVLGVTTEELISFDSQRYFHSFNNVRGNNNGSITIRAESIDVKSLYEDKILLMKKLIEKLELEIQTTNQELLKYRHRYGDL